MIVGFIAGLLLAIPLLWMPPLAVVLVASVVCVGCVAVVVLTDPPAVWAANVVIAAATSALLVVTVHTFPRLAGLSW